MILWEFKELTYLLKLHCRFYLAPWYFAQNWKAFCEDLCEGIQGVVTSLYRLPSCVLFLVNVSQFIMLP